MVVVLVVLLEVRGGVSWYRGVVAIVVVDWCARCEVSITASVARVAEATRAYPGQRQDKIKNTFISLLFVIVSYHAIRM